MHPHDSIPLKRCSKCGQEFPTTTEYFYRRKEAKDGLRTECRHCTEKRNKRWQEANPERVRRNARYRAARYRSKHKEVVYQRTREWKARNPRYLRQYMDQWREQNDARLRAERLNQRAEARGFNSDFTADDWEFALSYFEGQCAVCGRQLHGLFHTVSADHWIPLSDPDCPGTVPTNIVPLCCGKDGCNESKGNRSPKEWLNARYGMKQSREVLARIHEFFSLVRD